MGLEVLDREGLVVTDTLQLTAPLDTEVIGQIVFTHPVVLVATVLRSVDFLGNKVFAVEGEAVPWRIQQRIGDSILFRSVDYGLKFTVEKFRDGRMAVRSTGNVTFLTPNGKVKWDSLLDGGIRMI